VIRFRYVWTAMLAAVMLGASARAGAHDLERTQVTLTFATDGSFVLDVANDANWLRLRLEDFARDYPDLAPPPNGALADAERDARLRALAPMFSDRLVMWIDHAEVRPASAEYLPPATHSAADPPIGTFRLRGRVPLGAHTLQWFYGIVVDPYPLTIHRADKRQTTNAVLGNAWSDAINLEGQFQGPTFIDKTRLAVLRGSGWTVMLTAAIAMALWIASAGILRARQG
jgi:hypothetical protein